MDMDCCWQSCLFQQLQGSVWVTIHRYHHAAKEWQHSPHTERQSRGSLVDKVVYFNSCKALCGLRSTGTTIQLKDGSTARIQRVAAQPAYRETIQGVIGTMSHLVNLFIHHEMITHLASRKYATPEMRMEPGTKVEGWPSPFLVRYGRGYQCPTGCNTCDWFHLSPPWYLSVRLTLHSPSTLITLGPHEAGIWAKHPSLTLPAPSRYGDQQTPWLQLSAGGAHPVFIDCWLEWPVGLIHEGHAWSPPGIISKMTRRLVEFWKSLNHNST